MRSSSRRHFLQDTAAVAAAFAAVQQVPSPGGPADDDDTGPKRVGPNDTLRVAVCGVNSRGKEHIQGWSRLKDVRITTICDVDLNVTGRPARTIEERCGTAPKIVQDIRRVLDDKSIDAVSIATPNHWHALATIWACQAGKDVYVEKPVSHNVSEGRRMVEAARKYNRIVQTGTQCRSHKGIQDAMAFLHQGKLGQVYMAKGLCYKPRGSIGVKTDGPVPSGVDYNVWQGPAPEHPFNPNRFHYNWHWFWDYGNGDLGNQGIHQMDLARWGLNKNELPKAVMASGGRFGYSDQGQTPNTLHVGFEFDDCDLQFEVRGLYTNAESNVKIGDIFYGTEGILAISSYTEWQVFLGRDLKKGPGGKGDGDHFANFVRAVKARDPKLLNADIEQGHLSSAYCHLGNIAYRLGRKLHINPSTESFVNDSEADAMLTRDYRAPFVVPTKV
jgi:predicted dehydrogenase